MTSGSGTNSHIDERGALPRDLCVLLETHPRDTWASARSPLAQFWIEKHNYLRRQSAALMSANADYRNERSSAGQFGSIIAPRLQGFLAELHGHHQIEDFHYFPSFRATDARLGPGLDVLAKDHELLHEGILGIVEAVNAFITTIREETAATTNTQRLADAQRLAADRYIAASEQMHARLERHLEDEEDLIIPLMLARGA
jgi:iron-sulfur cluster repair protein YtfE (RIC family)